MRVLICADSRAALAEIEQGSVHCCITSPPYWGLRSYGGPDAVFGGDAGCEHVWEDIPLPDSPKKWDTSTGKPYPVQIGQPEKGRKTSTCSLCGAWRGQFGLEPTPEMYVEHTLEFLRAIWRVLRGDGTLWLNLGDSYASQGGAKTEASYASAGTGNSANRTLRVDARRPPGGLKPKDLCGIPWRVVLAAQADGWYWRSVVPWLKRNPMPESTDDRPTTAHEYFFMLTKSGKPTYWTHRDRNGARQRPKADYRWQNQLTGEEVSEAPGDWKTKITCPRCEGSGTMIVTDYLFDFETECDTCEGKGTIQLWKRVNLWRGHDYYWDADAIRMPLSEASYQRLNQPTFDTQKGGPKDYAHGTNPNRSARKALENLAKNPTGRNRRTTDWFYESIRYILDGGERMLLSPEGDPLALCVNTRPYKGAHYATFPPGLILPMILAGTAQKVCAECGAGWKRVTERAPWVMPDGSCGCGTTHGTNKSASGAYTQGPQSWARDGRAYCSTITNLGFRPTCSCDAETKPAVILDPFCGRGTVLKEARANGRDWIGIDVDPQSIKLAEAWLNLGDVTYEIDEEHWIQPQLVNEESAQ